MRQTEALDCYQVDAHGSCQKAGKLPRIEALSGGCLVARHLH